MRPRTAPAIAGALIAAAALATLAGCAVADPVEDVAKSPVGHGELQLVGDWTGIEDDSGDGVVEMVVTGAADDGSTFDGDLTFAISGDQTTEAVHAEMTPLGHLVAIIGDDASIEVHIVDPATLDYCFMRYGTDFVYSCGRLGRV